MEESKRIYFYGNSLILGSIGASLRLYPEFEVMAPSASLPDMQDIDSSKPNIIVCDMETTRTEAVLSLLKTNTDLMVIGVSAGDSVVQVWSRREFQELSIKDLIEKIVYRTGGNSD